MSDQLAFFFDATACSGCKTCQMACKDKHSLNVGRLWRRVYEISALRVITVYDRSAWKCARPGRCTKEVTASFWWIKASASDVAIVNGHVHTALHRGTRASAK
jgi:Fe-S-cluster-containing dehydrogenase component